MKLTVKNLICVLLLVALPAFSVSANDQSGQTQNKKSNRTAQLISLGCTIAPTLLSFKLMASKSHSVQAIGGSLFSFGTTFGPGAGHAYSGRIGKFFAGAGIRIASLYFSLLAAMIATESDDGSVTMSILSVASATVYLASTVHDISTSGDKPDARHRTADSTKIGFGPTYQPHTNTGGVMLTIRF